MARLTNQKKEQVDRIIRKGIDAVLRFKVAYDLRAHLANKTAHQWSSVAAELHNNYPIRGMGVLADCTALSVADRQLRGQVIVDDVGLAPEQAVDEVGAYPVEAAALAYIFSVLEVAGDDLVEVLKPGSLRARQSWHFPVHGDIARNDRRAIAVAKRKVAAVFGASARRWSSRSIQRLAWLKAQRNAYAHDLSTYVDFEQSIDFVLSLFVQLAWMADPSRRPLKVYPFEDHLGVFR
jgi:hypothetical protein